MSKKKDACFPMPGSWKTFLRVGENKDDHFKFLACQLSPVRQNDKVINSTCGITLLSSLALEDISEISPCTHEGADSKMMLHIVHCVNTGHNKIILK